MSTPLLGNGAELTEGTKILPRRLRPRRLPPPPDTSPSGSRTPAPPSRPSGELGVALHFSPRPLDLPGSPGREAWIPLGRNASESSWNPFGTLR